MFAWAPPHVFQQIGMLLSQDDDGMDDLRCALKINLLVFGWKSRRGANLPWPRLSSKLSRMRIQGLSQFFKRGHVLFCVSFVSGLYPR